MQPVTPEVVEDFLGNRNKQVEELAAEVVVHLRSSLDEIRNIACPLSPSSGRSRTSVSSSGTSTREALRGTLSRSDGLVSRVQKFCQDLNLLLNENQFADEALGLLPFTISSNASDWNESQVISHGLVLPLFYALWRCYVILDQVPPPTVIRPQQYTRTHAVNKPIPPVGMLSLQDYTDIAVMMEACVCLAILPYLEVNILVPMEVRAKTLPKSMVRRMPPSSLMCLYEAVVSTCVDPKQRLDSLQYVSIVLGNLLLLDRFRPVLLPRHVSDLHAAIFQVEQSASSLRVQPTCLHAEFKSIRSKLVPFTLEEEPKLNDGCILDSMLLARSYQTLLLHGKLSPSWMRCRVTPLLNQLATCDLAALIAIFVSTAPRDQVDSGGAAVRLASAILSPAAQRIGTEVTPGYHTVTTARDLYLRAVCLQATTLLDELAVMDWNTSNIAQSTVSILQSIWALINLLPVKVVHEQLAEPIQCTRRWSVLLSFLPPFVNSSKWMHLLLRASPVDNRNAIDRFLDQASARTIVHSPEREDAVRTLRLIVGNACRAFIPTNAAGTSPCVQVPDLLAVALLSSVGTSTCEFDRTDVRSTILSTSIGTTDAERIVDEIDRRADMLVKEIFLSMLDRSNDSSMNEFQIHKVISTMFLLLLDMYLRGINDSIWELYFSRLLPLVMLPLICEECPAHVLLNCDEASTTMLELMGIAFDRTASRNARGSRSVTGRNYVESNSFLTFRDKLMGAFVSIVGRPSGSKNEVSIAVDSDHAVADDAMLFSICSLLLSVLIGILELGAEERSEADEAILQGFLSTLGSLAEATHTLDDGFVDVPAELTSMATHAVALILSRQGTRIETHDSHSHSCRVVDEFAQIENDLLSVEVPMRARAVVSLRRLASSFDDSLSSSQDQMKNLSKVLSLSMEALKDQESYVYLAAIQTISAMADSNPRFILPFLGRAVTSGELVGDDWLTTSLSNEQRIKLAEALILYIRRKVALHEYLPILLDAMIVGGRSGNDASTIVFNLSKDTRTFIQDATHAYFVNQASSQDDALQGLVRNEEKWEEIGTRVRTGGPLFDAEESEVVRAAKLSVVIELVMASDPAILSRYCDVLVRCTIETVRLGMSRPIRRSGALLARELYAAMIREHTNDQDGNSLSNQPPIAFTVAMIDAREDELAVSLERALNQDDLCDLGTSDEKHRYIDPAMSARCQEALALRSKAVDGGMLDAGKLIAASIEAETRQSILRRLREPTRDNQERSRSLAHPLVVQLD